MYIQNVTQSQPQNKSLTGSSVQVLKAPGYGLLSSHGRKILSAVQNSSLQTALTLQMYILLSSSPPCTAHSVNDVLFLHVSPASSSHPLCPSRRNQSATASLSTPAVSSPSQQRPAKSAWPALSTTRAISIATCYWCEPARARKAWAVQPRFVSVCVEWIQSFLCQIQ